ncbi:hypothetical protein B0H14DRAFT_2864378, partial [Mycena olivaceomarginata]
MPPIRCESAVTNCHTDNISEYSALRPARNQLASYTVLVLCLVTQLVTGFCAPEGEGRGSLFNPHQTTTTFTFFVLRDRRHPTRPQSTRGKTPARAREAGGHGLGLCSFLFGFSPLSLIPTHPSRCAAWPQPLAIVPPQPREARGHRIWKHQPTLPSARSGGGRAAYILVHPLGYGAYLPPRAHDSPRILQAAAAWAWGTSYDIPMHPLPCSDCPHTLARPESPCPLLRRFL